MVDKIVVVFDSHFLRAEAARYAIELAKRTNSAIFFLVILEGDNIENDGRRRNAAQDFMARAQETILRYMNTARQTGIEVETEIRVGEPSSEFIKFLAEFKKIKSIVWGGSTDIANQALNSSHWLGKMKDLLDCPIVVPKPRML